MPLNTFEEKSADIFWQIRYTKIELLRLEFLVDTASQSWGKLYFHREQSFWIQQKSLRILNVYRQVRDSINLLIDKFKFVWVNRKILETSLFISYPGLEDILLEEFKKEFYFVIQSRLGVDVLIDNVIEAE